MLVEDAPRAEGEEEVDEEGDAEEGAGEDAVVGGGDDGDDEVRGPDDGGDEGELVDVVLAADEIGLAEGVEVQGDQLGERLEVAPEVEGEGAVEQRAERGEDERGTVGPDREALAFTRRAAGL